MGLVFNGTGAKPAATTTAAPGVGNSMTMDQLKKYEGIDTPQVFYNGGWQTSLPTDSPYYVDPWHNLHTGADMGNGYTFFQNIAPERNGTAELLYGWNDANWLKDNVKENATFNGQPGFAVKNSSVGDIGTYMGQGGRDNGKYAEKSGGLSFGTLLLAGAAAFIGQPWLAAELGGGIAGGAAAGAIIGGGTAALTGGDVVKGAIGGGIGGAFSGSGIAGSAADSVTGVTNASDGLLNVANGAIKGAINGTVSGVTGAALNGGSFASVIDHSVIGAAGGAASGGLQDAGITNPAILTAGSDITKGIVSAGLNDTGSTDTTGGSTTTTGGGTTTNAGGTLSFGAFIPHDISGMASNNDWSTPRLDWAAPRT